jgi:hypothetical protein
MTREEFNKIPPEQQTAALNKQFDDMGVLYKSGGIFKSTDMIGVFNVIQKSMAEEPDQAEE